MSSTYLHHSEADGQLRALQPVHSLPGEHLVEADVDGYDRRVASIAPNSFCPVGLVV